MYNNNNNIYLYQHYKTKEMDRAKKIISIFNKAESKFEIKGTHVSFEAWEEPFKYDKGIVITSEGFNIYDDEWNIEYTEASEFFTLTQDERVEVEGWIIEYYNSVSPGEGWNPSERFNQEIKATFNL